MIKGIKSTMEEVNSAIQNIAESAEDTAARSADVTDSVANASGAIDSIAGQATNQQYTANSLTEIVNNFRLQ